MGVPGLYRWLVQRYPLIRRNLSEMSRPKVDNFYIDFNCIIYNSLKNVKAEYPYTSLFQEVCRFLDLLVQLIRPENVLFIAVDGPAPFAKCAQQRSRRFLAARDMDPNSFDTTQVSVGTEFMELLHVFLVDFIKEKTQNDYAWKVPQVIYSSYHVPGEGEHKFFDYIRKECESHNEMKDLVHCIYSPDADLIFLGLQSRMPYFYILKEADSWIGPVENVGTGHLNKLKTQSCDFEFVCLSLAREYLKLDYYQHDDADRIIDDFATFSFLIGNDFIPHFPDISIVKGDFEIIVSIYHDTLMRSKQYLVTDGKLDKNILGQFLKSIVQLWEKKANKKMNFPSLQEAEKYLAEKYPKEYQADPEELKKKLTYAILESFDWVISYYKRGCQSWNWCFPYYYAPPLFILAQYCTDIEFTFQKDRPPFPVEQLLCILPPQSSKFLPVAAQNLMSESPISEFYPRQFTVDLNGTKFEHTGVVLIPLIDLQKVRDEIQKILPNLSEEERKRNTILRDLIFKDGSFQEYEHDIHIPKKYSQSIFSPPIGIPTFTSKFIQFKSSIKKCNVNVFLRPSLYPSVKLQIKTKVDIPKKSSQVKSLVNRPVLINWPYLIPALVIACSDRKQSYPKENAYVYTDTQFEQLNKTFLEKFCIDISDSTNIILTVKPLVSTSLDDGQFRFSNNTILYPYQLTVPCPCESHLLQRFSVHNVIEPSIGMKVVIASGENKGKLCEIIELSGNNMLKLKEIKSKEIPDCSKIIQNDETEWDDIDTISLKFKISDYVTNKLLKSISLEHCNQKGTNVAFTGFFDSVVLDGFCRYNKEKGKHQFTKDFINELGAYLSSSEVGNLLKKLQNCTDKLSIQPKELWDIPNNSSDAKISEFKKFMKGMICSKYFLIDDSISIVSQKTLLTIEDALLNSLVRNSDESIFEEDILNVIWPGKRKDFMQNSEIGSRVVNITYSGPIPFGERGIVVGKDNDSYQYQIVLINEFPNAHTLRKRLNTKRGYIAKCDDLFFY